MGFHGQQGVIKKGTVNNEGLEFRGRHSCRHVSDVSGFDFIGVSVAMASFFYDSLDDGESVVE